MKGTARKLTVAAMLSAVAFVLMFVEFSIPIMPSFIKLDVSDLPALLGAFSLGPIYGVVIELIKNLLHIIIKGTSSFGIGELNNFLLGAVFSFVAGLIYRLRKTRTGAIVGSIVGALAMGLLSLPINYFLVYPMYIQVYAEYGGWDMIFGMYQAILPAIANGPTANGLLNCLLVFNAPFTFCKGLLDVILCLLIYKPLSPILHGDR
jgi:riboflavin transporter FmnP